LLAVSFKKDNMPRTKTVRGRKAVFIIGLFLHPESRDPVAIRAPAVNITATPGMIKPTKASDSAKEEKNIANPARLG